MIRKESLLFLSGGDFIILLRWSLGIISGGAKYIQIIMIAIIVKINQKSADDKTLTRPPYSVPFNDLNNHREHIANNIKRVRILR